MTSLCQTCLGTPTGNSAKFYIPRFFLYIQFATELGYFAVYSYTANDRYKPVFFGALRFK